MNRESLTSTFGWWEMMNDARYVSRFYGFRPKVRGIRSHDGRWVYWICRDGVPMASVLRIPEVRVLRDAGSAWR